MNEWTSRKEDLDYGLFMVLFYVVDNLGWNQDETKMKPFTFLINLLKVSGTIKGQSSSE